ncbi:hypothetical protein SmJEL517_g06046 [Synchytrium microbalum]|uniref:Uncharacterized protein n=1 Tax=Synchytrium microbalum TaxID=1806994 RepID=A0A507BSF8_9FUNG|nr:uncharacterized protein SmJEL517_g06046 [Synchytrium microbalum]TPX30388.1 hypothetical protein SmJEL517_g06046 [Synchytrium microbalum]
MKNDAGHHHVSKFVKRADEKVDNEEITTVSTADGNEQTGFRLLLFGLGLTIVFAAGIVSLGLSIIGGTFILTLFAIWNGVKLYKPETYEKASDSLHQTISKASSHVKERLSQGKEFVEKAYTGAKDATVSRFAQLKDRFRGDRNDDTSSEGKEIEEEPVVVEDVKRHSLTQTESVLKVFKDGETIVMAESGFSIGIESKKESSQVVDEDEKYVSLLEVAEPGTLTRDESQKESPKVVDGEKDLRRLDSQKGSSKNLEVDHPLSATFASKDTLHEELSSGDASSFVKDTTDAETETAETAVDSTLASSGAEPQDLSAVSRNEVAHLAHNTGGDSTNPDSTTAAHDDHRNTMNDLHRGSMNDPLGIDMTNNTSSSAPMPPLSKNQRFPPWVIGGGFLGAGAACVFAPKHVLELSLTRPVLDDLHVVLMRCFGAQAMLVGLTWSLIKPTRRAYQYFGAAMLPFFAFDYWAINSGLFTSLIWADVVGNVVFLSTCMHGASICID